MSVDPRRMVSASAEKARLREEHGQPVQPHKVRNGKPCPIQPCPTTIPRGRITCDWHWQILPWDWRVENRVPNGSGFGELTLRCCCSVFKIYEILEEVGVPKLLDQDVHTGKIACPCKWCAPNWARARRALGVAADFWAHLLKTYCR
jgi:hypothetical protein